jgi:hypothetical protein
MVISASGNIGIGTTTPSYTLDVSGSGNFTDNLTVTGSLTVSGSDIFIQNNQFYSSYNATGTAVGLLRLTPSNNTQLRAQSGNNIAFETDGQNAMWIGNDQRVGIGTISPSAKLQVKGSGTTSATTALLVENANASASMVVLDNGNVGIGRIPFSYTVDISGSFRVQTNTLGLVVGTNGATEILTTGGNNGLYINDGNYSILKLGDYRFVQGRSAKTLSIRDSADIDVMFFASGSKNVGIGTTTPCLQTRCFRFR